MPISRAFSILLVLGLGCLAAPSAVAFSAGISGFSGDPGTGGLYCNECHSGGNVPLVTISGPMTVASGSTNTYTLRISGGQTGPSAGGGLDVSASAGTLSLTAGETNMQVLVGEITHTTPRSYSGFPQAVVWSFDWTAPPAPGSATIYGAGNSVNGMNGNNGDAAATAALNVTVTGAAGTPGETSDPNGLQPLLVTGYDNLTGEISISFESSCETDQNNIYFGPLANVSTHAWNGEVCDVGTAGTAVFSPGGGSLFFVVVGNKNGAEGSYGRTSGGTERPTIPVNTCGEVQDLGSTCTP